MEAEEQDSETKSNLNLEKSERREVLAFVASVSNRKTGDEVKLMVLGLI